MSWFPDELRRRERDIHRTYGDWVIWEQGLPCACHAATALRMSAGCTRCAGEGFVWIQPTKLKAILRPAHADRRLATLGWLSPADLTLSVDADHRIHDFDRVTLTVPLPCEPEVLTRGQQHREGLPGLAADEDRLAYAAVVPVHVATHDDLDHSLVHGDAYVFAGRTLRWLKPPPDGTVLVVRYEGLLEWVAFSSPFETIDRRDRLGQRVLLRKRHLVSLQDPVRRDVLAILGAP